MNLQALARRVRTGILIMFVFGFGYAAGTGQSIVSAQSRIAISAEVQAAFDPLFQVFNLISDNYVDEVPVERLVDGAIRGMVDALNDPYSSYLDPEYFPYVSTDLSGSIEGIGVVISEIEGGGEIEIINVLPSTPAERAGLRRGDVFYAVEGELVAGMNNLELAARVRGLAGTAVNLTMRRGDELLDFSVNRERIEIPNVSYELIDDDVAYISMVQFSSVALQQVGEAIIDLDVNSQRALIFDLRGNSGGFLSSAVDIAALFIEQGVILVEDFGNGRIDTFKAFGTQAIRIDQDGNQSRYSLNARYAGIDVPIVVLVDGRSASAAELVAGAWQDNGVVTIIGEPTFGKGTVQTQSQLINGGGVRLTIARWLTPLGNSISEQGVIPDILIELPEDHDIDRDGDIQLQAALDFIAEITGERE